MEGAVVKGGSLAGILNTSKKNNSDQPLFRDRALRRKETRLAV